MNSKHLTWPHDVICLQTTSLDARSIASEAYRRTCRVNFEQPGFCLINAGNDMDSVAFRQLMVALTREMAAIHESTTGNSLAYLSAERFDQQETTRPHLDGGPDECLLILGYEPSEIDSRLEIFDYAKCAFDHGIPPNELMAKHNPMFKSGHDILRPYSIPIPCFSAADYQIACINNSSSRYSESQPAWQGVLHMATVLTPAETKHRIINHTMVASVPAGTPDAIDAGKLADFVSRSAIGRRDYDASGSAGDA